MTNMKLFSVLAGVLIICVFANSGVHAVDSCLQAPLGRGGGGSCSGSSYCEPGFYCNNQSLCAAPLTVGAACIQNVDTCVANADCRGPVGNTICVAFASPGQSCSSLNTVTTPACGYPLICNASTTTCWGGLVNDTCNIPTDCASFMCSGKYCLGIPLGSSCVSSTQCVPGTFCQVPSGGGSGTCVNLLTAGTCIQNLNQCAYGYVCEQNSPTDTFQCLQSNSKSAGQYCGNSPTLCTGSMRCINGYCAKSSGGTCSSATNCAVNQNCACGGAPNIFGIGNCVNTCQYSSADALEKCLIQNCQTLSALSTYSGSCTQRLCQSQLNAYIACNSAGTLVGSLSLLIISALFVLFNKF